MAHYFHVKPEDLYLMTPTQVDALVDSTDQTVAAADQSSTARPKRRKRYTPRRVKEA